MRKKMYLLAGGPSDGDSTAVRLREALGGCGVEHPAAAYIGTASGDSRTFMRWFERPLKKAGAASLTMAPLVGRKADPEKAKRVLISSDVIFVSGGEVEDGMNGLSADIRALLRRLLEDGRLFIGLSAGTIMLGKAWPHWDDEDGRPEDAELFDCLGFAGEIFDTHAEAEGWPELKKAVSLSPEGFIGYGIPSGEMSVIDEDGVLIPNDRLVKCVNSGGRAVIY